MLSMKYMVIGAVCGIALCVMWWRSQNDGKLHVVFCNVGQGDAAYIHTPNGADMVIDGGPDTSVLSCLGRHMAFWDRRIDVVMMTHPQSDHMYGLVDVLNRYDVGYVLAGVEGGDIDRYRKMLQIIDDRHIPIKQLYQGDTLSLGDVQGLILWPSYTWVNRRFSYGELTDTNPSHIWHEGSAVLGYHTQRDLNDFSYYLKLSYGSFDVLFTGDGDERIQPDILEDGVLSPIEILKYPHHGSKTGMREDVLDILRPDLVVLSVGKNRYGHPAPEVIHRLSDHHIVIKRTDTDGDIEIISNGQTWWVSE